MTASHHQPYAGQVAGLLGDDQAQVVLQAELPPFSAAPTTGDPALAESLMVNLVGNAVRHNLDGGHVAITTATAGGKAVVTVSNAGPVIPPEEVDRLFEPFQRLGSQRLRQGGGHGLGLAIVSAIAGVHGADLTASARPGGGLDVTVRFPGPPPS